MNKIFTVIAGVLAITYTVIAMYFIKPHQDYTVQQEAHAIIDTPKAAALSRPEAEAQAATTAAPQPQPPVVWAVASSPHGRVSVEQINAALAHLQAKGLTKQGAAYLVGNYIAESYLTPCGVWGDGGQAHGLAQWHPGRRQDMPSDCALNVQLDWAIDVEMKRDGGGTQLYPMLFDLNATAAQLLHGMYLYERYGVEGNRSAYGSDILRQIQ